MTSFFNLLHAGGLMMLPLAAIIERARQLSGLNSNGAALIARLRHALSLPDEHEPIASPPLL